jgi:hypothetical protein
MNYSFNKESNTKVGTYSCGLPTVVLGVLIALKHIGMTSMTYGAIIWFTIEVWLCCLLFALAIWFVLVLIGIIFGAWK